MSFHLKAAAESGFLPGTLIEFESDRIRTLRVAELLHYRHEYRAPCVACGAVDGPWTNNESYHAGHTQRCAR